MSLFKTFALKERLRFTFRVEAFNVWNNPEFSNSEREYRSGHVWEHHVDFGRLAGDAVRREAVVLIWSDLSSPTGSDGFCFCFQAGLPPQEGSRPFVV